MTSIADSSVHIQTFSSSMPRPPVWWGELVLLTQHLQHQGILSRISEGVRFARRRFGRYEVIDFVAVLFGYAISGERTVEAFYAWLQPWAEPFMALFGRDRLPARSTLSRFLAALTPEPVEALRALFLSDGLSRSLVTEEHSGGLTDRQSSHWLVFDIDGTREAARQRALPKSPELPEPQRRVEELCAAGYTGRKRGEVVRTRTTVSQAHSYQWLGSFGNKGNGLYRQELRQALSTIGCYLQAHHLPQHRALLRLDGQYGTGAVIADLAEFSFVMRGRDYAVLDHPVVQARLHLPADAHQRRPESQFTRSLYDCPDVPVGPEGVRCRVVVAPHPAGKKKSRVGVTRAGIVYELFFTNLPQDAFVAADVVELYLHRGAFEPTLADEDQEQDPDRWCSHSPRGELAWQIISQWVWNLRLELGHHLSPEPPRTTEFAPATLPAEEQQASAPSRQVGYGSPKAATSWKAGRFSGEVFSLQPDGTLRCPAGKTLHPTEQRSEADGSLRLLYAARIGDCRTCPLREQCQWHGTETTKPRRVSLVFPRLLVGSAAVLWQDWSRRAHRRACMQLVRRQRVDVTLPETREPPANPSPLLLSRAQRAHARLSYDERLARNARVPKASRPTITLFGVPDAFAAFLGLQTA